MRFRRSLSVGFYEFHAKECAQCRERRIERKLRRIFKRINAAIWFLFHQSMLMAFGVPFVLLTIAIETASPYAYIYTEPIHIFYDNTIQEIMNRTRVFKASRVPIRRASNRVKGRVLVPWTASVFLVSGGLILTLVLGVCMAMWPLFLLFG